MRPHKILHRNSYGFKRSSKKSFQKLRRCGGEFAFFGKPVRERNAFRPFAGNDRGAGLKP